MHLSVTWPPMRQPFLLHDEYHYARCLCLNPLNAEIKQDSGENKSEGALFFWDASGPVILNRCTEHVCVVNGKPLPYDATACLRPGYRVQVGHVVIVPELHSQGLAETLYSQQQPAAQAADVCDVEDLLSYGGHHIAWMESAASQAFQRDPEDEVLQKLQIEYKKCLIWGEYEQETTYKNGTSLEKKRLTEDKTFEHTQEKMKDRTLTECIFESPWLFDKAFNEIMTLGSEQDELFTENKYDILHIIAPDNIPERKVNTIPALIAKEFYKRDLDSIL